MRRAQHGPMIMIIINRHAHALKYILFIIRIHHQTYTATNAIIIHTPHTRIYIYIYTLFIRSTPNIPMATGRNSAPMNRENNMPAKN